MVKGLSTEWYSGCRRNGKAVVDEMVKAVVDGMFKPVVDGVFKPIVDGSVNRFPLPTFSKYFPR